jgi:hypothetical protein
MLSLLTLRNLLNTMLTLASGATALGSAINCLRDVFTGIASVPPAPVPCEIVVRMPALTGVHPTSTAFPDYFKNRKQKAYTTAGETPAVPALT